MTRSAVLIVAILVALIQACTGLYLPEGIYQIKIKNLLLTELRGGSARYVVLMMPDSTNPGAQLWHVSIGDDDKASIRSKDSNLFLSFEKPGYPNDIVTLSGEKRDWTLESTEGGVFIETLEEFEGEKLVAGISPLRIWPPRVALAFPQKTPDQAWSFVRVEDIYEQPRQYRLPYRKAELCH
ncbi:hypothetical protein BGW38_005557 [Lunasporangiospora selenospora]|uniref:Uncharacterized protein n=1 Tax=Lunasporangiospora selenospora TaxID=979761 RepID=A0A9P6KBF8_9FUNG|nr:hypothetical protein BGW38_005557 [Lunasporangiospora selenospora]